jgi:hypothetical protein
MKRLIIKSVGIIPMCELIKSLSGDIHVLGHKRNLKMLGNDASELYVYPFNHEFRDLDRVETINGIRTSLNLNEYDDIIIPMTQNDPSSVGNIIKMLLDYAPKCMYNIRMYDTSNNQYYLYDDDDFNDCILVKLIYYIFIITMYPIILLRSM